MRRLIVNADDLGASVGINAGVRQAHTAGIVTSASLMVRRDAAADGARLAIDEPALSVGLHVELEPPGEPELDLADPSAVAQACRAQLDRFRELTGRAPTHLDSHHHVHRAEAPGSVLTRMAAELGVPLRGDGRVVHLDEFYAQAEPSVTDLSRVGVAALVAVVREQATASWSELGCHPGRVTGDLVSSYAQERERELETLTDPRVRSAIDAAGLVLASFHDLPGR